MQSTQDKNEPAEAREALNTLLPVVIQVEQEHLWLRGFQNTVTELLNFQASLERQLKLTAFNDNVWEVKQMNLERVKHAFASHNNLLGLFLYRQAANEGSNFFRGLPLGQLTKTLLTSPHARVDNLQEELSRLRVEDENCSVDWFCRQVAFKCLVDGDSVDICVVNEPDDLI